MKTSEQVALRDTLDRIDRGATLIHELSRLAEIGSFLFVGTAQEAVGHEPIIPLSVISVLDQQRPYDDFRVGWVVRSIGPRGGAIPVVQASAVGGTAIWAGVGGDVNRPLQRAAIDRALVPGPYAYDMGTYGHRFHAGEGHYLYDAHPDLLVRVRRAPEAEVLGSVDIIERDDTFTGIPFEPGHFASSHPGGYETVASIPVRAGDARPLWPYMVVPSNLNYNPLRPSDQEPRIPL